MSYNDGGYGRSNRGYSGRDRGHGNYGRFDDRPKPVETGKEYNVSITEISRQGDGIARVEGFVIFVKNGKIGQDAKIKITQVGGRFATAEVIGEDSPKPKEAQKEEAPKKEIPKREEAPKPDTRP